MKTTCFNRFLMAVAFQAAFIHGEPIKMEIGAGSAILINADTGHVLFSKEPNSPHYPASTTKVATALYTLKMKGQELDTVIAAQPESLIMIAPETKVKGNYKAPSHWLETDGTHIALKKGEEMTLRDLLYGLLIASGNDAANVIAQFTAGNVPSFMNDLNQYLKEIGCTQTHFLNPHGLHHPEHQTTAADLALMTREALKFPLFREIVSAVRFDRPKTNKQKATTFLQTNRLLRQGALHYSKAIGVKTGNHSKAKKNLVAAAQQEGRTLIAVLLHNHDRNQMFKEAIQLFEAAFNQPKVQRTLLKSGPQSFTKELPHGAVPLHTYLAENLSIDYYPSEDPEPKCFLHWSSLKLPIYKDQEVGLLEIRSSRGEILKTQPLFATEEVSFTFSYWLFIQMKSLLKSLPFLISLGLFVTWFIIRKMRNRQFN